MSDHLPGLAPVVREPDEITMAALEEFEPVAVYALTSGGNDSSAVAHWAASNLPSFDGLLHIDTTIGVRETQEYVRTLAKHLDVAVAVESRGNDGAGYEELVRQFGFPGPGFHGLPYALLKERPLRRVVRRAKEGHSRFAKVAFLSGARRQESQIRMGLTKPVGHVSSQLWINPFFDYSGAQLAEYRRTAGIPVNDVAALLGKSGECYCGAFAKPGELEDTSALGFPDVERTIRRLEGIMRREGHRACRWGERPPPDIAKAQREAGQLELLNPSMPMCAGCGAEPDDERRGGPDPEPRLQDGGEHA